MGKEGQRHLYLILLDKSLKNGDKSPGLSLLWLQIIVGSKPHTYTTCLLAAVLCTYSDIFLFPQAKIQKHQTFEAEIAAHNNSIISLKSTGRAMIGQQHFASENIQVASLCVCVCACMSV